MPDGRKEMAEIVRKEVKTYQVELICPECKKGRLRYNQYAGVLASYPPQYLHVCDNCGYEELVIGKTYPYIDYE